MAPVGQRLCIAVASAIWVLAGVLANNYDLPKSTSATSRDLFSLAGTYTGDSANSYDVFRDARSFVGSADVYLSDTTEFLPLFWAYFLSGAVHHVEQRNLIPAAIIGNNDSSSAVSAGTYLSGRRAREYIIFAEACYPRGLVVVDDDSSATIKIFVLQDERVGIERLELSHGTSLKRNTKAVAWKLVFFLLLIAIGNSIIAGSERPPWYSAMGIGLAVGISLVAAQGVFAKISTTVMHIALIPWIVVTLVQIRRDIQSGKATKWRKMYTYTGLIVATVSLAVDRFQMFWFPHDAVNYAAHAIVLGRQGSFHLFDQPKRGFGLPVVQSFAAFGGSDIFTSLSLLILVAVALILVGKALGGTFSAQIANLGLIIMFFCAPISVVMAGSMHNNALLALLILVLVALSLSESASTSKATWVKSADMVGMPAQLAIGILVTGSLAVRLDSIVLFAAFVLAFAGQLSPQTLRTIVASSVGYVSLIGFVYFAPSTLASAASAAYFAVASVITFFVFSFGSRLNQLFSLIAGGLVWALPATLLVFTTFGGNGVVQSVLTGIRSGSSGFGLFGPFFLIALAYKVLGPSRRSLFDISVKRFVILGIASALLVKIADPLLGGADFDVAIRVQGNSGMYDSGTRLLFSLVPSILYLMTVASGIERKRSK